MISAEVRRAVWDAAQDAIATGELPEPITPPSNTPDDPSTLRPVTPPRGGRPGQYVSTLPYHLAVSGTTPHQAAALLATRVEQHPWIAAATAAAGHLTVTVTDEALGNLAIRIPQVHDCAASDILRGMAVPAPLRADLESAPTWQDARTQLAEEVTGNLARKAGAEIFPERTSPPPPPAAPEQRVPGDNPVAAALAYAGPDAVRYALLSGAHVSGAHGWRPGGGVRVPVRYHLDNPVYAVRYAHAHAVTTLRQAADLGLAPGAAAEFAPRLLSQPAERALLGALSWLPERVAWAARSRRPGEFVRYTEELAATYQYCRERCPALPFGGRSAPRDPPAIAARLWLVTAAAAATGAGLALTGISAPARLLQTRPRGSPMTSAARPAGPIENRIMPNGHGPDDHPPAPPSDLNALTPAVWPRTARRQDGALSIGGIDVRDLAAEFGTPLFACDEADFRARCAQFRAAFGGGDRVSYAAKAFCSRAILRWAAEEGLGVDVCTGGELETALSAGLPGGILTLHGNNKSMAELARAVQAGVGHVVLDSFEEIARLAYLAERSGTRPKVLVRVTTGVDAGAHEFIATAHDDQKFGFSLASGAAAEAVRRVLASPDLEFAGLHSHIGSQIADLTRFESAARLMVALAAAIRDEHGVEIAELDLGGGYGIAYTAADTPADPAAIAAVLTAAVDAACAAAGLKRPRLTVEPGRAVAGPGTVTLYEVGTVKPVPFGGGTRTYVSVDGGMSDNIRTALYDARYTCVLASRESAAAPMLSRVVGRHCESGDIVVRHAYLPADLAPGDLLAVAATGAYCRSAASNYNHVPRPAVAAVRDGAARVLVRRETIEDLLRLDAG